MAGHYLAGILQIFRKRVTLFYSIGYNTALTVAYMSRSCSVVPFLCRPYELLWFYMGQVAKAQGAWLRAGRHRFDPGCRKGGDFHSVLRGKNGPGIHSASYKMSTGALPGVMHKGDRA